MVIVNPTAPVGDHDFKPTPTGKIILDFLAGGMPAYIDTGLNLVDVRDAAEGHLLALERGTAGRALHPGVREPDAPADLDAAGANLRAEGAGVAHPIRGGVRGRRWRARAGPRLTGREPRAPLDAVRMARKKMFASHGKAARELGFSPGPVDVALERAVELVLRPTDTADAMRTVLVVAAERREFAWHSVAFGPGEKARLAGAFRAERGVERAAAVGGGATAPGPRLAAEALDVALEQQRPDALVSTGFCGALDPA